ncbi:cyclin-dependent kinase 20 [Trichechus manatus latirostris]|uniref:Cyclin-dependent kinase 20 n=1 Tax=Trichechus manatus latirostris TaxID=127582 RepID=A0A2Y9G368_TRIMA|nr:cyclin-dependent kinase 20 [Trichechus manatus latirostris]
MDQYCILGRIGEGAHGIVFKAKHVETGEIVALKKVALRRLEDGIPNQALREIKALQEIEDNQYLKIADFGLARVFSPDGNRLYTHHVATRWYRAPELLYGARQYDQGVDLWAVGCIMGELLNGSPLFPGENDIEQLCCVLRILGTPSPQVWPALLHQYFFTAPLPAHPSELPIPQRPGGPAPKAHPGPPHVHDFHVDWPLEDSLLNPELIRPFIPEG